MTLLASAAVKLCPKCGAWVDAMFWLCPTCMRPTRNPRRRARGGVAIGARSAENATPARMGLTGVQREKSDAETSPTPAVDTGRGLGGRQVGKLAASQSATALISCGVASLFMRFALWEITTTFPTTYPRSGNNRSIDGELGKGPLYASFLIDPSGYNSFTPNTGQNSGAIDETYSDVRLNGVPSFSALTLALFVEYQAHTSLGVFILFSIERLTFHSGSFTRCLFLYSCNTWRRVLAGCFLTEKCTPVLAAWYLLLVHDLHSARLPNRPVFIMWKSAIGFSISQPVHLLVMSMGRMISHHNDRSQDYCHHNQDRYTPTVDHGPAWRVAGLVPALGMARGGVADCAGIAASTVARTPNNRQNESPATCWSTSAGLILTSVADRATWVIGSGHPLFLTGRSARQGGAMP